MPLLQIRECPAEIYAAIASDARRSRRTIAQQALVYLEQALNAGTDQAGVQSARWAAFDRILAREIPEAARELDAAQMVREGRRGRAASIEKTTIGEMP